MSINIESLSFSVSGRDIVSNVSGAFRKGKVTAVVGPNGSGKTSLLKLLSGNEKPTKGTVTLDGQPVKGFSKQALASQLATLPQSSPRPMGMTVYDVVACGRYPYVGTWKPFSSDDRQAVTEALHKTDILPLQSQLVDHLSGGEMQRVWLAMVLCQQTPYLLLDEPISFLDIAHQIALLDIVRQLNESEGKTIIWVLHDLNHALQYSDDIWVMQKGQLVSNGIATKVMDKPLLKSVFGINTASVTVPELPVPAILPVSLSKPSQSKILQPLKESLRSPTLLSPEEASVNVAFSKVST